MVTVQLPPRASLSISSRDLPLPRPVWRATISHLGVRVLPVFVRDCVCPASPCVTTGYILPKACLCCLCLCQLFVSIHILLFVFVIVVCGCVCAASAFVASIPRGCLSLFFGCVFVLCVCASTHCVASLLIRDVRGGLLFRGAGRGGAGQR